MSISTLYGFAANELKPGSDFSAGPDRDGKWTGSQTFTCRKFDYSSSVIQQNLRRGTKVTVIYPNLGPEWDFLTVVNHTHEHQPGGITKIFVEYEGSSAQSFEFGEDGKEVSYAMNATMTEKDLLANPKLLLASNFERQALVSLARGQSRVLSYMDYKIMDNYTGAAVTLATEVAKKYFNLIFVKGETTYQAPTAEWSVTKSNADGISGESLDKLGYIDTPEGYPPTFTGRNWLFSGASENRTKSNGGTIKTWTKTWLLSPPGEPWDIDIYTPLAP
jgi:hypothetical protein